jgi:hypothetical protein
MEMFLAVAACCAPAGNGRATARVVIKNEVTTRTMSIAAITFLTIVFTESSIWLVYGE